MTTIAWDGKTLATDKLGVCNGLGFQTTKLFYAGPYVFAGCGTLVEIHDLVAWLTKGASRTKRPKFEDLETSGIAILIKTGQPYLIEGKNPVLIPIEDKFASDGSGRGYALAAMHLGHSAKQAVRFASKFDVFTGSTVDTYRVGHKP